MAMQGNVQGREFFLDKEAFEENCSSVPLLLFRVDSNLYPVVVVVHIISGGQIKKLILDMRMVRKSELE